MARFTFEEDFKGFDGEDPTSPWQMIPQGRTRMVKLVEGNDDLEIRVVSDKAPPEGLEKSREKSFSVMAPPEGLEKFGEKRLSPTDRLVPLRGRKIGSYKVQAIDPKSNKMLAQLLVDVVKVLTLRIAYYLLPGSPKWNTRELNDAANKIWSDQAGVDLVWLGEWPFYSGEALPNENEHKWRGKDDRSFLDRPLANLDNSATKGALMRYGNNEEAGLMVYFTTSQLPDANGQTFGSQTLLDSLKRKLDTEKPLMVSTLAHEIGHRVSSVEGHDDKRTDLMFDGSPHGNRLRKARIMRTARGL